jgi:pimeloyl-ACP methyl ester carboxylesterase
VTAIGVAAIVLFASLAALGLFTEIYARRVERRFPPAGDLVAIEGGSIHIVEKRAEGAERGVALLLHGASGNHADMMVALAGPLSGLGFRVLAVDRPGHGWSSRILGRRAASPARQAELIHTALARRGVVQAIVVGHSLAGVAALGLALDAPQFTRALVLLAPVSHPWPGGVNWYYTLAAKPWIGWAFRQFIVTPAGLLSLRSGLREVFSPNETPANYAGATGLNLMFRPRRFRANAQDVVDLKSYVIEQSRRYRLIAAPTEIVTGDSDGVVYAHIHSVGCARDIPEAVLTTLPGVGHSPHYCATQSVVAAILRAERRAAAREAALAGEPIKMGAAAG